MQTQLFQRTQLSVGENRFIFVETPAEETTNKAISDKAQKIAVYFADQFELPKDKIEKIKLALTETGALEMKAGETKITAAIEVVLQEIEAAWEKLPVSSREEFRKYLRNTLTGCEGVDPEILKKVDPEMLKDEPCFAEGDIS